MNRRVQARATESSTSAAARYPTSRCLPHSNGTCAIGRAGKCEECATGEPHPPHNSHLRPGNDSFAPPIVHDVLRSFGEPLDRTTRGIMEQRFGHDFSRVRVHTDTQAAQSAAAVRALAYTVGNDIVFGARTDA